MKRIYTLDNGYSAIDQLISKVKSLGHATSAAILHHRLHEVAWTTRSELFEELRKILSALAIQCYRTTE